jgi:hypothetical protein
VVHFNDDTDRGACETPHIIRKQEFEKKLLLLGSIRHARIIDNPK